MTIDKLIKELNKLKKQKRGRRKVMLHINPTDEINLIGGLIEVQSSEKGKFVYLLCK